MADAIAAPVRPVELTVPAAYVIHTSATMPVLPLYHQEFVILVHCEVLLLLKLPRDLYFTAVLMHYVH